MLPSDVSFVQWFLVAAQIATLGAVIVYVWKTWQMAEANAASAKTAAATLEEIREDRRARQSPKVLVYFSAPESHLAQLVIENAGETTATDVQIEFDPPLRASGGDAAAVFVKSPKVLPPRSRMTHLFDSWHEYFGKQLPLRYVVSVRYRPAGSVEWVNEEQAVDVGGFQHIRFTRPTGLKDITEELQKLRRSFESYGREHIAELIAHTTRDELLGVGTKLPDAVRLARTLWRLHDTMAGEAWVAPNTRGFHLAIRTLIAGAIAETTIHSSREDLTLALQTLYARLSDHRLQCIGDQTEVAQAVELAFIEVEQLLNAEGQGTSVAV